MSANSAAQLRQQATSNTVLLGSGEGDIARSERARVISIDLDSANLAHCVAQIVNWANAGSSKYVCAANVHMVIESLDNPAVATAVQGADLVTSDGMPLVWLLRRQGIPEKQQVTGFDLMLAVCLEAERSQLPVALFGGTDEILAHIRTVLAELYPKLPIVAAIAPPFKSASELSAAEYVRPIVESRAKIVLVSLGCPKQELWMAACRGHIGAVMLGVGAAFDFLIDPASRAPHWMQRVGLEWAFRLYREPQRLWRRYVICNTRFITMVLPALLVRSISLRSPKSELDRS